MLSYGDLCWCAARSGKLSPKEFKKLAKDWQLDDKSARHSHPPIYSRILVFLARVVKGPIAISIALSV